MVPGLAIGRYVRQTSGKGIMMKSKSKLYHMIDQETRIAMRRVCALIECQAHSMEIDASFFALPLIVRNAVESMIPLPFCEHLDELAEALTILAA